MKNLFLIIVLFCSIFSMISPTFANNNLILNKKVLELELETKKPKDKAEAHKEALFIRALTSFRRGNSRVDSYKIRKNPNLLKEAIEFYTYTISLYPISPEFAPEFAYAYNNRGYCYLKLKQYDKAISDFTKAISIRSNFEFAYNNRGTGYYKLKQYDKAIADYTKAINTDSKFANAYANRGNCYLKLKQYDKAIADYTKAINTDSKYVDAYEYRGNCYIILNQYDKAISDFIKALKINISKQSKIKVCTKIVFSFLIMSILIYFTFKTEKKYEKILQEQDLVTDMPKELPDGCKRFSWGAYAFPLLWIIFNKTYRNKLALILLILGFIFPYVIFISKLIFGIKGNEWAYKSKTWKSVGNFNRTQRNWAKAFWYILLLSFTMGLIIGLFI